MIHKEISTRGVSNYHAIEIKNWKNEKEPIIIVVSKSFYKSVNLGVKLLSIWDGYKDYERIDSISKNSLRLLEQINVSKTNDGQMDFGKAGRVIRLHPQ